MPPKNDAVASSSSTAVPPKDGFESLSEEEVLFCWRTLVDEGRLSAPKLMQFMNEVGGVKLSMVQAKDLLNYMDADSDGNVGKSDFKYFMSVGRLEDTTAKEFMWTPKAKYQEEHGKSGAHAPGDPKDGAEDANFAGFAESAAADKRSSVVSEALQPSATPGKSAARGGRGKTDSSHGGEAWAEPSSKGGHTARSSLQASSSDQARDRQPPDPKFLAKIATTLENYEKATYEKYLKEEKDFERRLFQEFCGEGGDELDVVAYHNMLKKWFPLASWCTPGDLRSGDSIAALQSILAQERKAKAPEGTCAIEDIDEAEAKMSFELWLDVVNGKYRPEAVLSGK